MKKIIDPSYRIFNYGKNYFLIIPDYLRANIVIAAKTGKPHPTLPGTIYTAADEIEAAGGRALPIVCDVR